MQYKTIVLELLQQRPQMHQQLCKNYTLMTALEMCATELKARHQELKEQLAQAKPASEASQISSEAFEMALKELEDRLPPALRTDEVETLSLDQAMASIRNPSSRG
jgi:hypothetical protein